MQQRSHGFVLLFLVVFISGMVFSGPSAPRRSRGQYSACRAAAICQVTLFTTSGEVKLFGYSCDSSTAALFSVLFNRPDKSFCFLEGRY